MASFLIILGWIILEMCLIDCQREPERYMTPKDPVFLVNDTLRLNCSLRGKLNGFNSSDLVFKLRFYGNSSDVIFPSTFVNQTSNRTAQLMYDQLQQEHHLAKVFCDMKTLKNDEYEIITVGHAPHRPEITQWWLYNWEELIFEWDIPQCDNGFETNYTAWYKNRDSDEFSICNTNTFDDCPPPKSSSWCRAVPSRFNCSIPDALNKFRSHGGYALLKVTASNKKGRKSSKTLTTDVITLRVQPGPVQDLVASCDNSSDVVTFLSPKRMEHMCFHIHVECDGDQFEEDYFLDDNETYMDGRERIFEFKGLPYYAGCSVSVRGIPLEDTCDMNASNASNSHCWSAWVNTSFVTHQDVPANAPEIIYDMKTIGQNNCCQDFRDIVIYYKPLENRVARGVVYCYRVRNSVTNGSRYFSGSDGYNDDNGYNDDRMCCQNIEDKCPTQSAEEISKIYTYNDSTRLNDNCSIDSSVVNTTRTVLNGQSNKDGFFVEFFALINETYSLTLDARTGPGFNDSLQLKPIIIPKESEVPPGPDNFTVISISCTETMLSWSPPKENINIEGYTVIWCEGSMNDMICMKQPIWFKLNPTDRSHTANSSVQRNIFGVSLTTSDGRSSRIQWASCVYDYSADASPPQMISTYTSSKITLTMQKPACSFKKGYVHGFAVHFFLCRDPDCSDGSRIAINNFSLKETEFILELPNLKSATQYQFFAYSLTSSGRSLKFSSLNVTTSEEGLTEEQRNGIIAGSVIGGIAVLFGIYTIIKCNKRMIKHMREWWNLNLEFDDSAQLNKDHSGYIKSTQSSGDGYSKLEIEEETESTNMARPPLHTPPENNPKVEETTSLLPPLPDGRSGNNPGLLGGAIQSSEVTSSNLPCEEVTDSGGVVEPTNGSNQTIGNVKNEKHPQFGMSSGSHPDSSSTDDEYRRVHLQDGSDWNSDTPSGYLSSVDDSRNTKRSVSPSGSFSPPDFVPPSNFASTDRGPCHINASSSAENIHQFEKLNEMKMNSPSLSVDDDYLKVGQTLESERNSVNDSSESVSDSHDSMLAMLRSNCKSINRMRGVNSNSLHESETIPDDYVGGRSNNNSNNDDYNDNNDTSDNNNDVRYVIRGITVCRCDSGLPSSPESCVHDASDGFTSPVCIATHTPSSLSVGGHIPARNEFPVLIRKISSKPLSILPTVTANDNQYDVTRVQVGVTDDVIAVRRDLEKINFSNFVDNSCDDRGSVSGFANLRTGVAKMKEGQTLLPRLDDCPKVSNTIPQNPDNTCRGHVTPSHSVRNSNGRTNSMLRVKVVRDADSSATFNHCPSNSSSTLNRIDMVTMPACSSNSSATSNHVTIQSRPSNSSATLNHIDVITIPSRSYNSSATLNHMDMVTIPSRPSNSSAIFNHIDMVITQSHPSNSSATPNHLDIVTIQSCPANTTHHPLELSNGVLSRSFGSVLPSCDENSLDCATVDLSVDSDPETEFSSFGGRLPDEYI